MFKFIAVPLLAATALAQIDLGVNSDLGIADAAAFVQPNGIFAGADALNNIGVGGAIVPRRHKRTKVSADVNVQTLGVNVDVNVLISLEDILGTVKSDLTPVVTKVKSLVGQISSVKGDASALVEELVGEISGAVAIVNGAVGGLDGVVSQSVGTVEGVAGQVVPTPDKVALLLSTVTTQVSSILVTVNTLPSSVIKGALDEGVQSIKNELCSVYTIVGQVAVPVLSLVQGLLLPVEGLLGSLGLGSVNDILETIV